MSRRTFWIILLLGAALRALWIAQAGLWYDENFSLLMARLPIGRMLAATAADVHPPLFYLTIWPLGQIAWLPPWAIRLPSLAFSIGALALFPRILRRLNVPARVQAFAFGMMAILPMQLAYAQEARMYALMEFLALVAVLAVLEWRPVLLAIATAAMLYTLNYGTFYVATIGAVLGLRIIADWWNRRVLAERSHFRAADIGRGRVFVAYVDALNARADRRARFRWILMTAALVAGVALWLPWVPVLLGQMDFINAAYWIFDLRAGAILYEVYKLFWSTSLPNPAASVATLPVTFAVLILGAWNLITRRPPSWLVLAALAFGPILMAIAASFLLQPVLLFRPLIGVTPFVYLVCAYPLASISGLRGRLYAACFVAPVVVMALIGYYRFNPSQKTTDGTGNMQRAVDYITAHWEPGDVLLNASALGWVNLQPYIGVPQYAWPDCILKFPGSISPGTHDALGIETLSLGDVAGRRVWYVAVISPVLPACELSRTEAITRGIRPAVVMSESDLMISAVWLLEGQP